MPNMPAALATDLQRIHCDYVPVPEPGARQGAGQDQPRLHLRKRLSTSSTWAGTPTSSRLPHGYPGHEGLGEVIDGGGTDFAPGDLVLTAPNIWSSRTFAGYQLIDPNFLLKLPRDVPEEHLLMAQQLGTVVFGCRRLPSLIGQTVVVVGQGSVGLFHDFMLRRLGAHRIIGIEPVPERLAAGRAIGLDEAIDVSGRRATEAVLDLTGGEGADLVIEAVGSVDTLNQTLQLARPLGRVAVFGLPPTMERVPFDWDTFFRKRLDMHTVFGAQDEPGLPAFQIAVDFISRGDIDMAPFVTHTFPIDHVQEAFDLAHSKEDGALKVSLTF